ncbi:MAG: dihydroorotase family protein [Nitrospinota bacterium]
MAKMDTVIKGGLLVRRDGTRRQDIAIKGGKVVAVGEPGTVPDGEEVIDARNLHVIPGVIDPHVHLQLFRNPFDVNVSTETRSCAAGGVTTIIPMLLHREDATRSYRDYTPWAIDVVKKNAMIDVAFSAVLGTEAQIADIPFLVREYGMCSFKYYMAYTEDEARVFGIIAVDDGLLYEGFRQVRDMIAEGYPCLAMVHAENMEIIHREKRRLIAEGRNDLKAWTDARPEFCEEECLRRAFFFIEQLRSRLYVVHLTVGQGVNLVREMHRRGVDIIAETCPHYLTFTKHDHNKIGFLGKVNPPLRDKRDQEQLWKGLQDGTLNNLGSDHSTVVPRQEKEANGIWDAIPGFPMSGCMLPVMLHVGVHSSRLTLERLVELTSYNVARAYGLLPRKGDIAPGYDADIVLVDLEKVRHVTPDVWHSAADWSLYDGWDIKGWPVRTMVRGVTVAKDGEVVGSPKHGQYIPRDIPRRPAA